MPVENTSLLAYMDVQPKIGLRQKQVYEAIKLLGVATDRMIVDVCGLPINCVTPRRGELKELGEIRLAMEGPSFEPPHRMVKWWTINEQEGSL